MMAFFVGLSVFLSYCIGFYFGREEGMIVAFNKMGRRK